MSQPALQRALPQISSFARDLLRAFDEAERFAKEKGGVTSHSASARSSTAEGTSWTTSRASVAFVTSAKTHRQLLNLYTRCIRDSVDDLCDLLCTDPALQSAPRQRRVDAALSARDRASEPDAFSVSAQDIVQFLDDAANSFREQHDSLGRSRSNHTWVSDWNPDWRTQNLVWTLLKKLGSINSPPEPLVQPYQTLKEVAFACLFQGDYLASTRRKCSFKQSFLRYVPIPGKWDADLTWVGTAVFISMPLASLAHSWDDGNRLAAFWGTFLSLFAGVSVGILLLYASYRSSYSNALLDKAARGTPYERGRRDGPFSVVNILPGIGHESVATISTARSTGDLMGIGTDGTDASISSSVSSERRQEGTEPQRTEAVGSVLHLYQASMFVERIYGSTYIDESWMLGMTEQQLYDAVLLVLQTAGALGRQTSAFSFTSLAIATRGVPDPALFGSRPVSAAVQGAQVSFAIFSFLGALAFSCGMMSAMLSDLILRQMAFTQVKSEGTAHAFVKKFAFFIRAIGGLNSCAGMSLFTGVMVFLLSIFRVHPIAVVPLGAAWLILGSLLIESFFTKFHFWNMSEIIDDVGNVIQDPDIQSPSPVAGTIQHISRRTKKWVRRRKERNTDRQ